MTDWQQPHWQRRQWLRVAAASAGTVWANPALWSQEKLGRQPLKVISESPLVCETELEFLAQQRITPVEQFFIRNNGNIPEVNAADYRLHVEGMVEKTLSLSLADLKKYAEHKLEATLMCAGNRRTELNAIQKVSGTPWGPGGIGNAEWTGISLADLLCAAGIQAGAKHVQFQGLDEVPEKKGPSGPFGSSLPLELVMTMQPTPSALLCYAMNGEPLTKHHGAPLRVMVPGVIGSRCVKWLSKIIVSDRESPHSSVQTAYKIVKSTDSSELANSQPLYHYPVNGFICTPASEARVNAGKIPLKGYALASGKGNAVIKRAMLKTSSGQEITAKLLGENHGQAWRLWEAELELTTGKHEIELTVEDSTGAIQPARPNWNYLGYLNNARHKIVLHVA